MQTDRKKTRQRIRYRIRRKIAGTAERPRVAVCRSLKHIYVQAIDDSSGRTMAAASSRDKEMKGGYGGNIAAATQVGEMLAKKLKAAGVRSVVFDRGGVAYHGRVKALAEAAREGGLRF